MVKLNVGCGGVKLPGYIGIDSNPRSGADIIKPAHNLPYKEGTVDEIRSSHMLEHVKLLSATLSEWFRVLKPGGLLWIRVPNFEVYVREWLKGDKDYRIGLGLINLYGHQDKGPGMYTRTGFTCWRFKFLLPRFGFVDVKCRVGETRVRSWPDWRENGDIFCECRKPRA